MPSIVFDVDGTLIDNSNNIRKEVFDLAYAFYNMGFDIYVHSGGGLCYTFDIVNNLCIDRIKHADVRHKDCIRFTDKIGNLKFVEKDDCREYDICVDDSLFETDNPDNFDWSKVIKAKVYIKV